MKYYQLFIIIKNIKNNIVDIFDRIHLKSKRKLIF